MNQKYFYEVGLPRSGNDQGVTDSVPAQSTSFRAADNKEPSSDSVTHEKRRLENQENGGDPVDTSLTGTRTHP